MAGSGVKKGYWGRKIENKPVNPPKPKESGKYSVVRVKGGE